MLYRSKPGSLLIKTTAGPDNTHELIKDALGICSAMRKHGHKYNECLRNVTRRLQSIGGTRTPLEVANEFKTMEEQAITQLDLIIEAMS